MGLLEKLFKLRKFFRNMDKQKFKAVSLDIDGTLIENGDANNLNSDLKKEIKRIREKGILFSINSGRDIDFERALYNSFIGDLSPIPGEALLYEDVGLSLIQGENYVLGGLNKDLLEKVENLFKENSELLKGLVSLPNSKSKYKASRVTKEFAENKPSNKKLLEEKYIQIKDLIEEKYGETAMAIKSADAIDIIDKNANKKFPFEKYLLILEEEYSISPKEVLFIGDSENDFGAIEILLQKGGSVGFVGDEKKLTENLRNHSNLYVSDIKGPKGTADIIRNYF